MKTRTGFLRDYLSVSWRKKPAVFRGNTDSLFADPSEILEGLRVLAQRLRQGERNTPFRLYGGGQAAADPHAFAVRESDLSLDGYLSRLEGCVGGAAGLVVNQFQVLHPSLFLRSADFLDDLYEKTGMPAGGASLEMFAGNYRTGPFGVHKDEQEVITFVVQGKKRFLLWPFEALRKPMGAGLHTRHTAFAPHTPFDYAAFRSSAIVLEGGPGDVLCWPREWWHVAESDGGRVVTVALGLFLSGNPLQHAARVAGELWRQGVGTEKRHHRPPGEFRQRHLETHLAAARNTLLSSRLARELRTRLLGFQTAAGFHEIPEMPAIDEASLADEAWLQVSRSTALAWSCEDSTAFLAARGRVLGCPAHPRLIGLLRCLARGKPMRVGDILSKYSGRAETETTIFTMEPGELRGILIQLLASGALKLAGRGTGNRP